MNRFFPLIAGVLILVVTVLISHFLSSEKVESPKVLSVKTQADYWFLLHRKSNQEFLYQGVPGEKDKSKLIKTFKVKSGILGQKPTPLPELLGKKYWVIEEEFETPDNPETAPYFLKLDIPYSEEYPYGPTPYQECNGQCDWQLPGSFGLHGVGGISEKLSQEDSGSSGCVRHSDQDITYLYNLLDPKKEEIRYYIEDI